VGYYSYCLRVILHGSGSEQVGLLHNSDELLLGDLAVAISVGFIDHLLQLIVSHGLAKLPGYSFEVSQGNLSCVVIVEQAEGLENLFARVTLSLTLRAVSTIFAVMSSMKSENSITPLPYRSTSAIIFLTSSFLGSKPRARMATLSSLASI
jgi:hypothetical protein